MGELFVFRQAGAQDLNIGGGTFGPVTLPDGSSLLLDQIGSHTFLEGLRDALENGLVGDGATDDSPALDTLANTTLAGGGTIFFGVPSVSYRIKTTIALPANVMLVFAPGAVLNIDNGVVVKTAGTIAAPNSTLFSGLGVVFYGSRTTRTPKLVTGCAPFSISAADTYLPKPGEASVTITVPKFSTVRQIRLVIVDPHPADGRTATYEVTDGSGGTVYISQTQNSGDPAAIVAFDATLALPHVTGNSASFILTTTGTDQVQYKGWLEVEFY